MMVKCNQNRIKLTQSERETVGVDEWGSFVFERIKDHLAGLLPMLLDLAACDTPNRIVINCCPWLLVFMRSYACGSK